MEFWLYFLNLNHIWVIPTIGDVRNNLFSYWKFGENRHGESHTYIRRRWFSVSSFFIHYLIWFFFGKRWAYQTFHENLRGKIVNFFFEHAVKFSHSPLQGGRSVGRSVDRPTSLHRTQHIHIHTICCRITETYNKVSNLLTYNFSKEKYMFPEDDLRIETRRSVLNVLV